QPTQPAGSPTAAIPPASTPHEVCCRVGDLNRLGALPAERPCEGARRFVAMHDAAKYAEIDEAPVVAKIEHLRRSVDFTVCLSTNSNCRMLVLPELFIPKSPVIGARRMSPVSAQDLKPYIRSDVNIAGC